MTGVLLISLLSGLAFPLQSLEIETRSFFFCQHKRATAVESRTVRIHQFSEENKCAVIYSVKGQDQVVSQGRWLSFCKKKARQIVDNLQEGLWKCEQQGDLVQVFYSISQSDPESNTI